MTDKIIPVIIAGGKETRLWPLSRTTAPKQFIRFVDDLTLFQAALMRTSDANLYEAPVVVTNEDFRFLAAEQARELGVELSCILLEPIARNTAPAIAVAADYVANRFGAQAVLQIIASDHEVVADVAYLNAIRIAHNTALIGKLVTFGIFPIEATEDHSYIEIGEELPTGASRVKRFIERPDQEIADVALASGNFARQSRIFMFTAAQILDELAQYVPEVVQATRAALAKATGDMDFIRLDPVAFAASPNISFENAVMEKSTNATVVPSSFTWSDMGSWDAFWKRGGRDEAGNVATGNVTLIDTKNSLIMSRHMHLAVQGMEGVAVIASEDAVYVVSLDDSQKIEKVIAHLGATKNTAALTEVHPTSYRPWGGYTSILNGDRFQVKRLFVTPGRKLSLQKHHHRSEHWICVKGTAEVTIGDKVYTIGENESVYIPQGDVHRLANPGKIQLEMIEVQTGSYLGEDDIIRIVDEFGRE